VGVINLVVLATRFEGED